MLISIGIMFSNTNFELIWSQTPGSYRAKEDGSLYIGEWYQERYNSYYYGEDGRKYVGFQTINGKQYYFEEHSGWLYKNKLVTDENGKTYQSLNDSTHYFGAELEQHVLQDANGNGVTVTETTNGDYYYMDDNGTGYIDNGDGTWTDENGNSYTE